MQRRLPLALLSAAALVCVQPRTAAALVIAKTYAASLSTSAKAVIDTAIAFYETAYSDPITVTIEFHDMGSGLGQSDTFETSLSYAQYRAALLADATSANDLTALANTAGGINNPVNGSASITLKTANARAVGLSGAVGTFIDPLSGCVGYSGDSCIGLNLSNTNDTQRGFSSGSSLITVVEHEINEALGLGSTLTGTTVPINPAPEDLFRWASAGTRSFNTNACGSGPAAYFSIDGGATNLNGFNNCANGADYGDWVTHTPTQIQDAITNGTSAPFMTTALPESVALDVIGYTLAGSRAIPEPASLALLTVGLLGLRHVRRRRADTSAPGD